MRRIALMFLLVYLVSAPVLAHSVEDHPVLVIDTDAGLDDMVALSMALQHSRLELAAIVATEGTASGGKAVTYLERLLHRFNRSDVGLYAGAVSEQRRDAPPFRETAERLLDEVLTRSVPPLHRPFSPKAYVRKGKKTTVLVLGPLTNFAAALRKEPEIKSGIEEVIVAGPSAASRSWNLSFDTEALATVNSSGLPVEFVAPGPGTGKPVSWLGDVPALGRGTAIGEAFFAHMLSIPEVRAHYAGKLKVFHDELAFLYYLGSDPFEETEFDKEFTLKAGEECFGYLRRLLTHGRQENPRVILVNRPLPDEMLQEDVRARREAIVTKNGEEEWFAEVLLNEMHEHLGAYSVIGVKMGLRAAEILNAPRHGMEVVSRVPAGPPVSCFNDGLIAGTGCTPGRDLFQHLPGDDGSVRATFSYNGREVTLVLKDEFRQRVRASIRTLLAEYTLEDDEYWVGVRRLGLEIWENWHRLELFHRVSMNRSD